MNYFNCVIPAQAGIQRVKGNPRSGQRLDVVVFCTSLLIDWIPACAGMTN
jgi:hypothetical protein